MLHYFFKPRKAVLKSFLLTVLTLIVLKLTGLLVSFESNVSIIVSDGIASILSLYLFGREIFYQN